MSPNWFNCCCLPHQNQKELSQEWRLKVKENLKNQSEALKILDLAKYEKNVGLSSYVKSVKAKSQIPGEIFEDCLIELDWICSAGDGLDFGTFTILNPDGVTTKMQFSLSEITCVQCSSESGSPEIALHAPTLPAGSFPIKLQFSDDTEMKEWLAHLTSECCPINEVQGPPPANSVWITSSHGGVFAYDPDYLECVQWNADNSYYIQRMDVSPNAQYYDVVLYNGMPPGTELEITGFIAYSADQITIELKCPPNIKVRHEEDKLKMIAMHLNPRFNESAIILNSMVNSQWLTEVVNTNMVFSRGEFNLVLRSNTSGYQILVNKKHFCDYKHRIDPKLVSCLYVSDEVKLFSVTYRSLSPILPIRDMFWRQIGGHLKSADALSTSSSAWRELFSVGLKFKKISAVPHFLWAIGGDRQVYFHVHGLDVPIRVKEESYENERWYPFQGYSSNLLPTDRYHFSSADGSVDRSIEGIKLPSKAWQWEGDWHVECSSSDNFAEWFYAVDFPYSTYYPVENWTTHVRRRKWVRFRRFTALNSWCAVAPLHKDPTQEPFIDVAIGGTNVPEAPQGTLVVWAITAHGRVMFLTGVSTTLPEGLTWTAISTPSDYAVAQISVGASGLVWAVLLNGRAIVRLGVTRDNLTGKSWLEVEPPQNGLKIMEVSVGADAVWCVTNDNQIWYRRWVFIPQAGFTEDDAVGSAWTKAVSNISKVSIASTNKVFAVGSEERTHPESDFLVLDSNTSRDSGEFVQDDDHDGSQHWPECEVIWNCCSAVAVSVDPYQSAKWFDNNYLPHQNQKALSQEWRLKVIENLNNRSKALKILDLEKYEKAVELSSWVVKSGEAKVQKKRGGLFKDCLIELDLDCSAEDGLDSGTFTILNPDRVTTKMQFSLSEITCVQCSNESGSPEIAIYFPTILAGSSLIKLQFSDDTEMKEWLAHLTSEGCPQTEVQGQLPVNSVWITSSHGDVFVYDPSNLKCPHWNADTSYYIQHMDVSATETPYYNALYNGMPPGTELEITGCVYRYADQITFDLQCYPNIKVRHEEDELKMIAMHLNPRFNESAIILNSMVNSQWLTEVRNTNMVFSRGEFNLVLRSNTSGYQILVNKKHFCDYKHRIDPKLVSCLYVSNEVKLFSVTYRSPSAILPIRDLFWRPNVGDLKRVDVVSTFSSPWQELFFLGLKFKKISAVPHFLWAIGGDRQVYLHVHGLDVPIRVKEESYENERWYPFQGYSSNLLPTDCYHFSSADGSVDRSIEGIKLPSKAWQWEGDWHVECSSSDNFAEWFYAVDFPYSTYYPEDNWTTYVRRRKWVRFRRFTAFNSWCAVTSLHKDPTQVPFIDVAIGGTNVPEAPQGTLVVWAITAHGRVMFLTGVSTTLPEGLRWTAITTPSGFAVAQISVGATGLVWAVLLNGRAIVRSGVTRDNLTGETWLGVKAPGYGLKIIQVSVGTDSVWCVTNDNHVWFRRGVKGENAGISEDTAVGSGWIEIVGNMSMVSVAANDQVFAVGSVNRALYFRLGVSTSDLIGRKWCLIKCSTKRSRTSSTDSVMSRK